MNKLATIEIAEKPGRLQFFDKPPVSESATMLQVIASAASNPAVDVAKMEQLFALQAQIAAREAKIAFNTAFVQMQQNLPTIDRNGRIEIRDKNDDKVIKQSTPFADWADINEVIKPILFADGFGLSFRTGTAPDGKQRITAVLKHQSGHEEETYIDLMHDASGSKNSVQAVGSSVTYGKRYTACAILNITSRAKSERDTDGHIPPAPREGLDADQVATLQRLLKSISMKEERFTAYLKVASLADIAADRFLDACKILTDKGAKANG